MSDLGSLVFSLSLVPVGPLALLGLLGLGFLWSFPLVFRSSWFPLVSFGPFYLLGFSVSLALVGSCGLFGFLCSGGSLLGVITNTSHGFSCGKKNKRRAQQTFPSPTPNSHAELLPSSHASVIGGWGVGGGGG